MNRHRYYPKPLLGLILSLIGLMSLVALGDHAGSRRWLPASAAQATAARLPAHARATLDPSTSRRLRESFGKMPLYFIENRGQLDARVAYYLQGQGLTLYFTPQGITYSLAGEGPRSAATEAPLKAPSRSALEVPLETKRLKPHWTLKLDFVGANPKVKLSGREPTPAVMSYFKGSPKQWQTGLKTYASLVYTDLWPGIDLVYSGTTDRLKYSFVVKPGADPKRIKLAYRGATAVRLNQAGQLEVSTPVGGFHDDRPYAYQETDAGRVEVGTAFALEAAAAAGRQAYGLRVGEYDHRRPLVLDPAVFIYAGYIGGDGSDEGRGIAVDSAGNAYVTGSTASSATTFPETVGPDLSFHGRSDAFVAKVRADGTGLVYCGYIGGANDEAGNSIAVDGAGNAYITGWTNSDQSTFPVTAGPNPNYSYASEAFVAKVRADGAGLIYCGYIPSSFNLFDSGNGIAVDSAGNAYVAGHRTFVGDGIFTSAFVTKVRADGAGFAYVLNFGVSFFLGDDTAAAAIAVDSAGQAFITGYTQSPSLPAVIGPDLTYRGGIDAFVGKVRADGAGFLYLGFIGGAGRDVGHGIAVDSLGCAYVTGGTASDANSFPALVGPSLSYGGGSSSGGDAFVAKVRADGTGLVYCGYIGGSNDDAGVGIAVDGAGNAYVAGSTASTEASFPVVSGPGLIHQGSNDAFVAKVRADGTGLVYCGYVGGSGNDYGYGIAVDSAGDAYLTGSTNSSETTFPATVGPGLTFGGGTCTVGGNPTPCADAFVAKVSDLGGCGGGLLNPLGQQTSFGALSLSDCRSPSRGSAYYCDTYTFVNVGYPVAISLASTAFDTYLCLRCRNSLPPYDELVYSDDDGGGGTNSRLPAGSDFIAIPYLYTPCIIEVTSYWPNATGSYRLTLSQPFQDVAQTSPFYDSINRLAASGITAGCDLLIYCPDASVTRAQMAVFLERAMHGAAFEPPLFLCLNGHTPNFTDVACPNFFAGFIESLRDDGITAGCAPQLYCPNDPVTRAQMAIFLLKAKHGSGYTPPPATGTRFLDVQTTTFGAAWIEQLAAEGITSGCGGGNYCPGMAVTRGQMAAFLVRAFNL